MEVITARSLNFYYSSHLGIIIFKGLTYTEINSCIFSIMVVLGGGRKKKFHKPMKTLPFFQFMALKGGDLS